MKPVVIMLLLTTTILTGCFKSDHNYGEEHVKQETVSVSSEKTATPTQMYGLESSNIVIEQKASQKLKADEAMSFEPKEFKLHADSKLEEYIGTNLMRGESHIPMSGFPESENFDSLLDVVQKVHVQNPLILGIKSYGYNYGTRTLIITYHDSPMIMKQKQSDILDEARKIVSSIISQDMEDEEKRKAIYDWLNSNATYDYWAYLVAKSNHYKSTDDSPYDSFTSYGVLINKMGVCNSYASAFKLLADMSGIESIVVTGKLNGVPHAWNKVKIGDDWLNTDATNNATNAGIPYMVYNSNDETAIGFDLIIGKEYWLDAELDQFKGISNKSDYYAANELEVNSLESYREKIRSVLLKGDNTVVLRYVGKIDPKALQAETEQLVTNMKFTKKLVFLTLRNYVIVQLK